MDYHSSRSDIDLSAYKSTFQQVIPMKDKSIKRKRRNDSQPYSFKKNKEEENKRRWTALMQIFEFKISEGDKDLENVSRYLLEQVGQRTAYSGRELERIWKEYTLQINKPLKHFSFGRDGIISMISNRHMKDLTQQKFAGPSPAPVVEEHQTHFRPRWDDSGHEYDIDELVELIASVNNKLGQRLKPLELSLEMLAEHHILIPERTMRRILKEYKFDKEVISAKPYLTLVHRRKRLQYVLSQIVLSKTFEICGDDGKKRSCYKFAEHLNRFEIDEKWFKAFEPKQERLRRRDEDPKLPSPKVVNKDHIPKIMFLIGVGVPQRNPNNNSEYFDGKLGIWPFAVKVPAERTSVNRTAGTMVVQSINVTSPVFKDKVLQSKGVLDKIKEKIPWLSEQSPIQLHFKVKEKDDDDDNEAGVMPDSVDMPFLNYTSKAAARGMNKEQLIVQLQNRNASTVGLKPLLLERLVALLDRELELMYTHGDRDCRDGKPLPSLQMDNATPHVGHGTIEHINRLLDEDKNNSLFQLRVTVQPPRSPDFNKLDMSINRSLASRAASYKIKAKNLSDIIVNVMREFDDYPIESLERAYAQTFALYRQVLIHNGDNDFPSPHEGIRKKLKQGEDIVDLYADVTLVKEAQAWLVNNPLPPVP